MFVRFVVGTDTENPYWLDGVITVARIVRARGELFDDESDLLEDIFDSFNNYLPCPPFRKKLRSGEWTRNAVCWFRDEAGDPLMRIWDIVAILRNMARPSGWSRQIGQGGSFISTGTRLSRRHLTGFEPSTTTIAAGSEPVVSIRLCIYIDSRRNSLMP